MLGRLGWSEILIIVFILVILFGAKRIPDLARSIGQGIRLFKKGLQDVETEIKSTDKKEDK